MSTRWYPLYQKGNPQLRVFLPNFWLKLVEPKHKQPKNVVQFHCSMEMTKYDIRNYLEKIYNVNVVQVKTRIQLGEIKRGIQNYVVKADDIKVAYVILDKNETFEFPNLFPKSEEESKEPNMKELRNEYEKYLEPCKEPGAPGWFRI